jgi:hypothetical protein
MISFNWKTCIWPENEHPMPLCRHVWERHLREQNGGDMPLSQEMLDKQWDLILALQGTESCPCTDDLKAITQANSSPDS